MNNIQRWSYYIFAFTYITYLHVLIFSKYIPIYINSAAFHIKLPLTHTWYSVRHIITILL